jgi:hypothetical protein
MAWSPAKFYKSLQIGSKVFTGGTQTERHNGDLIGLALILKESRLQKPCQDSHSLDRDPNSRPSAYEAGVRSYLLYSSSRLICSLFNYDFSATQTM